MSFFSVLAACSVTSTEAHDPGGACPAGVSVRSGIQGGRMLGRTQSKTIRVPKLGLTFVLWSHEAISDERAAQFITLYCRSKKRLPKPGTRVELVMTT